MQTTAPRLQWAGVACSADGKKLAAVTGGQQGQAGLIYVSTNSGATWTSTSASPLNLDKCRLLSGWEQISCLVFLHNPGNNLHLHKFRAHLDEGQRARRELVLRCVVR